MSRWIPILVLLFVVGCGGSEGGDKCANSSECVRGKVCSDGKCSVVDCAQTMDCAAPYTGTFCWKGETELTGICTAVECQPAIKPCPAGQQCMGLLCLDMEPMCTSNSECKQPAEKCYNGECVLVDYCLLDEDCPSGSCDIEQSKCFGIVADVVEEDIVTGDVEEDGGCVPANDPVEFLCLECTSADDCGCGVGVCVPYMDTAVCLLNCMAAMDCPSGYMCQDSLCKPTGGQCGGCVIPDGCPEKDETCDFKTGACMAMVPECGPCSFDYECGFGSRCWPETPESGFCAPECDEDSFSCPLASGCEQREGDEVLVCLYTGKVCCYGLGCDTCTCVEPTPICLEDGSCAQCLSEFDCPPGKPICDAESHTCVIQCVDPTPVYWQDPDTGAEYCVQCATSKDCPAGMFCGTFENDPETYHKCYQP